MLAAGGKETGWIRPAWKMWRGSQATAQKDYHSEMNQVVFDDWFHTHLLPNSVVVLDRAPYHKMIRPECKGAIDRLAYVAQCN